MTPEQRLDADRRSIYIGNVNIVVIYCRHNKYILILIQNIYYKMLLF